MFRPTHPVVFLTLGGHQVVAPFRWIAGIRQPELATHGVARNPFAVAFQVSDEPGDGLVVLDVRCGNGHQIRPYAPT